MKFVIKSGSLVKLFSGEMKIDALAQFLKENFTNWNANNLFYVDTDGDRISIKMQEDIDAMLAMNPHAQYIKLEVVEERSSGKEEEKNVEPKMTHQVQKKEDSTIVEKKTEISTEKPKETTVQKNLPL